MIAEQEFTTLLNHKFGPLKEATLCPYAVRANVRYAPEWNPTISTEANVADLVSDFTDFEATAEKEGTDMYVMGINNHDSILDLRAASVTLRKILEGLRSADSSNSTSLIDDIETLEWNSTFGPTKYFVPFFLPFYDPSNPRYSHSDHGFLAFQPDHSFTRHNISKQNPHRYQISEKIRDRFNDGGTPYDINLVVGTPKAVRYIKPLKMGDPVVKWWEVSND